MIINEKLNNLVNYQFTNSRIVSRIVEQMQELCTLIVGGKTSALNIIV